MLSRASRYLDVLVSAYQMGCCCSSGSHEAGRGSDIVVLSDWDTIEDRPGGFTGHIPEPTAVRQAKGGREGKLFAAEIPALELHRLARESAGQHVHASASQWSPEGSPRWGGEGPVSTPRLGAGIAPADIGSAAAAQEALVLRELMKRFVQEMIQGKTYSLVLEDGRVETASLVLSPNLQSLQLRLAETVHDVPLRNIKDVCPGATPEGHQAAIPLDELCSTLLLRNNECVTFKLDSVEARDEFTKCVKVLALALES